MGSINLAAIVLIILAFGGMYLESQDLLKPSVDILTGPNDAGTPDLAVIVIAFVTYILVLSFLDTNQGLGLTTILILGALYVNVQKRPKDNVFKLLGVG
jgi:hypothetical protein